LTSPSQSFHYCSSQELRPEDSSAKRGFPPFFCAFESPSDPRCTDFTLLFFFFFFFDIPPLLNCSPPLRSFFPPLDYSFSCARTPRPPRNMAPSPVTFRLRTISGSNRSIFAREALVPRSRRVRGGFPPAERRASGVAPPPDLPAALWGKHAYTDPPIEAFPSPLLTNFFSSGHSRPPPPRAYSSTFAKGFSAFLEASCPCGNNPSHFLDRQGFFPPGIPY